MEHEAVAARCHSAQCPLVIAPYGLLATEIGIDFGQGYCIDKPIPMEEFLDRQLKAS